MRLPPHTICLPRPAHPPLPHIRPCCFTGDWGLHTRTPLTEEGGRGVGSTYSSRVPRSRHLALPSPSSPPAAAIATYVYILVCTNRVRWVYLTHETFVWNASPDGSAEGPLVGVVDDRLPTVLTPEVEGSCERRRAHSREATFAGCTTTGLRRTWSRGNESPYTNILGLARSPGPASLPHPAWRMDQVQKSGRKSRMSYHSSQSATFPSGRYKVTFSREHLHAYASVGNPWMCQRMVPTYCRSQGRGAMFFGPPQNMF